MATPQSSGNSREVRRFQRAAQQRLAEAQFLLEHNYTTAAVYLGGYAVECALKALILSSEPVTKHRDTLLSFRGTRGHSFDWLIRKLAHRSVRLAPHTER